MAKVNYHIPTDAIKEILIPDEITKTQAAIIYANEADVLNVALCGKTAKQWREENTEFRFDTFILNNVSLLIQYCYFCIIVETLWQTALPYYSRKVSGS